MRARARDIAANLAIDDDKQGFRRGAGTPPKFRKISRGHFHFQKDQKAESTANRRFASLSARRHRSPDDDVQRARRW
jgi:hypothetical protein